MSEPKRYMSDVCNLGPKGYSCLLIQHKEGEFVRYEDYARLKAEVERLTALVESNLNQSKVAMANSDASVRTLEAQVERLTKAGDAMAAHIERNDERCYIVLPDGDLRIADWNAAKEGKPRA
jgi:hypothetical protein